MPTYIYLQYTNTLQVFELIKASALRHSQAHEASASSTPSRATKSLNRNAEHVDGGDKGNGGPEASALTTSLTPALRRILVGDLLQSSATRERPSVVILTG